MDDVPLFVKVLQAFDDLLDDFPREALPDTTFILLNIFPNEAWNAATVAIFCYYVVKVFCSIFTEQLYNSWIFSLGQYEHLIEYVVEVADQVGLHDAFELLDGVLLIVDLNFVDLRVGSLTY